MFGFVQTFHPLEWKYSINVISRLIVSCPLTEKILGLDELCQERAPLTVLPAVKRSPRILHWVNIVK